MLVRHNEVILCEGKYSVYDDVGGGLGFARHGEPQEFEDLRWKNVVIALRDRVLELEQQVPQYVPEDPEESYEHALLRLLDEAITPVRRLESYAWMHEHRVDEGIMTSLKMVLEQCRQKIVDKMSA